MSDGFVVPHDGRERRTDKGGRRASDLAAEQQASIAAAVLAFGDLDAGVEEISPLLLLIDCCRALVSDAEYGVLLREEDTGPRVIAVSSEAVRALDEHQIQHANGPSIEVLDDGIQVLEVRFTESDEPWVHFTRLVRALGFTRLYVIPLRPRGQVIGTVNVYVHGPEDVPSVKMAGIQTLAQGAAASLDNRRSHAQLNELARQLQHALDSRVLIEQAKGVIATKLAVTIEVAFEFLRSYSRSHNRSIREVAAEVISNQLTAEELPPMARRPRRSPGSVHK